MMAECGKKDSKGVFHLPRNSGNSGWDVNGTHVFGSFHWKFSGINGTSEKVVLFPVGNFPMEMRVPFTTFERSYHIQAIHGHIFKFWRVKSQSLLAANRPELNGTRFSPEISRNFL